MLHLSQSQWSGTVQKDLDKAWRWLNSGAAWLDEEIEAKIEHTGFLLESHCRSWRYVEERIAFALADSDPDEDAEAAEEEQEEEAAEAEEVEQDQEENAAEAAKEEWEDQAADLKREMDAQLEEEKKAGQWQRVPSPNSSPTNLPKTLPPNPLQAPVAGSKDWWSARRSFPVAPGIVPPPPPAPSRAQHTQGVEVSPMPIQAPHQGEAEAPPSPRPTRAAHPSFESGTCFRFLAGRCKAGSTCRFRHEIPQKLAPPAQPAAPLAPAGRAPIQAKTLCFIFWPQSAAKQTFSGAERSLFLGL